MTMLNEILTHKREEVRQRKKATTLAQLRDSEYFSFRRLSLQRALRRRTPAIIAEVKKASPSRGVLREEFDPLAIARQYIEHGASAISVLTDEKFFQGKLQFISSMRTFVNVPLLRKDFIIDRFQLCEAKAAGADAVLLIAAALDRPALNDLHDEARSIDLECLVEVHSREEIESLDFDRVRLVGINNRDLATFRTTIETSLQLRKFVPEDVTIVSESGIAKPADISRLMEHGINAFLVGETLMKAENPGLALRELYAQAAHAS